MTLLKSYKHTFTAAVLCSVSQAIIVNFAPLLFLTFQSDFALSLSKIAFLVTLNFLVQLTCDLLGTKLVSVFSYRTVVLSALLFASAGIFGLGNLPFIMNPYAGLIISTVLYAIGGGLIEVITSPIVEACPIKNKSGAMSLLHSFYCWGFVIVIAVSTLFFKFVGIEKWRILAMCWAALPLLNAVYFLLVPIYKLEGDEKGVSLKSVISKKVFWLFFVLMICSGAAEQAIAQWASAFAEAGLKVPKAVGDLLGPMCFSVLMGVSRLLYALFGNKINQTLTIFLSSCICVFGYLITVFSPLPVLSLIGCAVTGLGVGILWPGLLSLATGKFPQGGASMFALLALGGDVGCSVGPMVVGTVSDAVGGALKWGILSAIVFPLIMAVGVGMLIKTVKKDKPVGDGEEKESSENTSEIQIS